MKFLKLFFKQKQNDVCKTWLSIVAQSIRNASDKDSLKLNYTR